MPLAALSELKYASLPHWRVLLLSRELQKVVYHGVSGVLQSLARLSPSECVVLQPVAVAV